MTTFLRTGASLTASVLAISVGFAGAPAVQAATHRPGLLRRHPVATSVAAGAAAYHVARHSRRHGRGNFAQRHPFLTGVAAAGATHHVLRHRH